MTETWNLDQPLLRLSPLDTFTTRDACEGVHVFGGIGSGKTSGTGQTLAGAYLRANFGGLVLCAKPEEVELWKRYAAMHGRANSVIVFDERQCFNFLGADLARQGIDGIGSVIESLMRVIDIARRVSPSPGGNGDQFWQDGVRQILVHTVPALYLATGTVNIDDILSFVLSAPTQPGQHEDPKFQAKSLAYRILAHAAEKPFVPVEQQSLKSIMRYWFYEFPGITEKTRSGFVTTLSTTLGRFSHGRLNKAFCGKTTVVPEMCFNGALIIMAMPTLTWNEDGIIGQHIVKYMWQRIVLARNALPEKFRERPVFLWADEAQYFVNAFDSDFLAACRGSRACTVFMSQNLPTYYAKVGQAEEQSVDALIGKFGCHIFNLNPCPRTNAWASSLVGRGLQRRETYNTNRGTSRNAGMNSGNSVNTGTSASTGGSFSRGGASGSTSWSSGSNTGAGESWGDNRGHSSSEGYTQGYSETMDNLIEPAWFSHGLRSGGPAYNYKVSALLFRSGGNFRYTDGGNVLLPVFQQVKQ